MTPENKKQLIAEMNHGDIVTVKVNFCHPTHKREPIKGTVHKGRTNFGKDFFYIQPLGDNHPGASITAGDITEVVSIQTAADALYNNSFTRAMDKEAQAEQERYEAEEAEKFARRALSNPYRNDPDEYRASWGGY